MKTCPVLLTTFLAAILGGIGSAPGQQRPSLDAPALDSSGIVNLIVRGDRGTNYAIEASTDLTVWWRVFSGVASNGEAQFAYAPPPGSEARYFRARVEVPLPPLNVTVQLDTNNVDVALLTPDRSATLSLTDENGTSYTLTVPTNAVADAQVFYMTVVTNLPGLPFAAGEIGAVSIVPAGLALQSPAQLEITFSTNMNINPDSVAAYGFDEDGSFLRLTLGFPDTNRITIPVLTLGGYGCSSATFSEVEQLSQRPVGAIAGGNAAALQSLDQRGRIQKQDYPLDDCHPEQLKRALAVGQIIANSYAQLNSDLTFNALQTLQRVPGLSGNPLGWNVSWLGNQDAFWHDFYQQNIVPFLIEAEQNCALTQVMEWQVSVLDATEEKFGVLVLDSPLARLNLCRGYENCINTIDQCCKEKGLVGQASVDAAQAFADKAAKMNCLISPTVLEQAAKDCLRTNWSGNIIIETKLTSTNVAINGPVTTVATWTEDCFLLCKTDSNGLNSGGTGAGYYGISGPLDVAALCFFDQKIVTTDTSCCRTCVRTLTAKARQKPNNKGTASSGFIWQLTNSPPPPFPVPLPNIIVPGNDLITATHNVKEPTHVVNDDWASLKGGPCFPHHTVNNYTGMHDFAGIAYLNFFTAQQGTAAKFAGHWETNFVSPDGIITTFIQADWDFTLK